MERRRLGSFCRRRCVSNPPHHHHHHHHPPFAPPSSPQRALLRSLNPISISRRCGPAALACRPAQPPRNPRAAQRGGQRGPRGAPCNGEGAGRGGRNRGWSPPIRPPAPLVRPGRGRGEDGGEEEEEEKDGRGGGGGWRKDTRLWGTPVQRRADGFVPPVRARFQPHAVILFCWNEAGVASQRGPIRTKKKIP